MTRGLLRSVHLTRKSAFWSQQPSTTAAVCMRCFSIPSSSKSEGTMTEEEIAEFKKNEDNIKKELLEDAGFLTKSIYRTCLRSVRLIRPGNERDEAEFQEREKKRKEQELSFSSPDNDDARLGMFSMLPPVDREDELRSRAEYYHQYARENLVQETDCLPLGKGAVGHMKPYDVERFVFLIKKGEKERRWLLDDMGFPDPYQSSFPKEKTQQFETKAMDYIRKSEMARQRSQFGATASLHETGSDEDSREAEEGDEDVPQWIRDRYLKKTT